MRLATPPDSGQIVATEIQQFRLQSFEFPLQCRFESGNLGAVRKIELQWR